MITAAPVPTAPEGMTGAAALAWAAMARTIAQARPISDADRLKMEAAASAWARWRAIEAKLGEVSVSNPLAGELSKGANGQLQVSPLRQAASAAFAEFNALAAALGLNENADLAAIDLFGYPDRPGRGKKGRPTFTPTLRDHNRVRLLLAMGWANQRIASALEISLPTLQKYFRAELAERELMADRLEARRLELAMEQANTGNISALRELGRLIERQEAALADAEFRKKPKEELAARLGKKEQLADEASRPSPDWQVLLDEPVRPN